MKKILIGCLFLLTACQSATPTFAPSLFPTSTPQSTLISVTSFPEPSPTLEPTETPFPNFFTNEFDSSLAGWVILQAGNEATPNVKIEEGRLTLEMDSSYTWDYALYGAQDYSNVRIDTQFTNRALTPASTGLICRYSEDKGWFEYNVSADGTYNVLLGKWLDVGISQYTPITDGSSKLILPTGSTQTIGLACIDSMLSLYINDTLVRKVDVSSYNLPAGKVGLATASYENTPIVIGFEWAKVSAP